MSIVLKNDFSYPRILKDDPTNYSFFQVVTEILQMVTNLQSINGFQNISRKTKISVKGKKIDPEHMKLINATCLQNQETAKVLCQQLGFQKTSFYKIVKAMS